MCIRDRNALDDMSNEAVEYVRGIPVVKTFGQTVFSFKKFKDSIDRYKVWVIAYTKQLRTPMMFYTCLLYTSVICDPKSEILRKTGGALKANGYEVRVFDLLNPDLSLIHI